MRNDIQPEIVGPNREFAERFRQAMQWAGLLVFDPDTKLKMKGSYRLAEKRLGIVAAYIGELYRGIKYPSGLKVVELANRLGVSPIWLITGEGPMVSDSIISIEHLHPEDKTVVLAMIKSMERKI